MYDFMTPPADAVTTRWGPIWLSEDGIIINLGARASQSREEVARYMEHIRQVSAGKPRPLLIEISRLRVASKEVRDEYDRQKADQLATAMALVTTSAVSKMIGNMLVGFNKSKIPFKLFTDAAKAREWLVQYI